MIDRVDMREITYLSDGFCVRNLRRRTQEGRPDTRPHLESGWVSRDCPSVDSILCLRDGSGCLPTGLTPRSASQYCAPACSEGNDESGGQTSTTFPTCFPFSTLLPNARCVQASAWLASAGGRTMTIWR